MFTVLFSSGLLKRFAECSRGAVAPMVALMLIPMLGATALAVDVGYWYYKQRDMQSAADSAALAAARTPDEDPTVDPVNDNFINVARGTAAQYGYANGEGTVTVDAERVQCPSETDPTKLDCTQVTIGYTSPLFFSPIVGFQGNKNGAQGVAAVAVAGDQAGEAAYEFCLMALKDNKDPAIEGKGTPNGDLAGCDIYALGNISCKGDGLKAGLDADHAVSAGTSSEGCAAEKSNDIDGVDEVPDPYLNYADNLDKIPDPCKGSYPQANDKDVVKDASGKTVSGNMISGSYTSDPTWKGTKTFCGDVVLTGALDVSDVTFVIFNGRLITQKNTLTADNSTLVFTGDNASASFHYPTGTAGTGNVVGSGFDIDAPDEGPWNGMAIYIDPALTNGVAIPEIGNAPKYNIDGIFYAPNSDVTVNGIVNKDGSTCFVMVVGTIRIVGTGQLLANLSGCAPTFPTGTSGATIHKWLVQ